MFFLQENVDDDSWRHLCKIRRDKIQSEERIQALESDIAETDQVIRFIVVSRGASQLGGSLLGIPTRL